MSAEPWMYGSIEWVWTGHQIRVNFPGTQESFHRGSYQEVVEMLTHYGMQGWEVVTCVSGADWVYWTLKRKAHS